MSIPNIIWVTEKSHYTTASNKTNFDNVKNDVFFIADTGQIISHGKLFGVSKVSLTGAVTGSGTFNNGEISIATTVNHNHDSAYLKLTGGTLSGDLKFSNSSHILWNSGSWYQRIFVTDDSTSGTAVFTFQQSSDSGSTWTDLFTILDNSTAKLGSDTVLTSGNSSISESGSTATIKINGTSKTVSLSNHTHSYLSTSTKYAASPSVGGGASKVNLAKTSGDGWYPIVFASSYTAAADDQTLNVCTPSTTAANAPLSIYPGANKAANTEGHAYLQIGNNLAKSAANNRTGHVRIYGDATYYAQIDVVSGLTANQTFTLNSGGTVLTSGNSSVSLSGSTLTVKINGTSKNLTNNWRGIYTGGTSRVGNGTDTKAMNFVAGSGISISYTAAGTGDGQSGNANYFNISVTNTGVRSATINGNYLRVNTNGTNADLTIPYATSAGSVAWDNVTGKPSTFTPASHSHNVVTYVDSRDTNHTPTDAAGFNGIRIDFKNKATSGITSSGTWTAIVSFDGYSDTSGGYPRQMGFSMSDLSENSPFYVRSPKSATEWGAWRTLIDSSNYTDYVNTTNFAGLNKTGTVTSITFKAGTGISLDTDNTAITTSGTRTISIKTPSSGDWFGGTAFVGTDGIMEIGRYIDFHPTNASTLDYSARIDCGTSTTVRTFTLPDNGGTILTSGNSSISESNSVVTVKVNGTSKTVSSSGHTHSYLPLSGGTISNDNFSPLYIQRNHTTNYAGIGFKHYSSGTTVEVMGYLAMGTKDGKFMRLKGSDTGTSYTILDSSDSFVANSSGTGASSDQTYTVGTTATTVLKINGVALKLKVNSDADSHVSLVKVSPTSGTNYYPTFYTSAPSSATSVTLNNNSYYYITVLEGVANTEGYVKLTLGNSTAKSAAGNSRGYLIMYSQNAKKGTFVVKDDIDTDKTYTFAADGIVLTSGNTYAAKSDDTDVAVTCGTSATLATINGKAVKIKVSNPNTDYRVNISETNPASGTWYYPVWHTAASGSNVSLNANDGFRMYSLEGTASAAGRTILQLGNATATGTAKNKYGELRIYAQKAGYAKLIAKTDLTAETEFIFATAGTVLTSGNSSISESGVTATVKINNTSKTVLLSSYDDWEVID